jgi:hypothetical protein
MKGIGSKRDIAWAVLLVILGIGGAYFSFNATRSFVLTNVDPDAAVSADSSNATAMASQAVILLSSEDIEAQAKGPETSAARLLALASLKRQMLNPTALALLGTISEIEGDQAKAKFLFEQGARQTKRNLGINLWQIRNSSAENDVAKMLTYYDRSLRTQREAYPLLLPALAKVLPMDPAIVPLADILRSRPDWAPALGDAVIAEPTAWPAFTKLLSSLGPADQGIFDGEVGRKVILALTDSGKFRDAATLLRNMGGKVSSGDGLAISNFESSPNSFPPFDWQYIVDGDKYVVGTTDGLELEYGRESGALLARRIFSFKPGQYRLTVDLEDLEGADSIAPVVQLFCATASEAETAIATSKLPSNGEKLQLTFQVTRQCEYHWLRFITPLNSNANQLNRILVKKMTVESVGGDQIS